MKIKVADLEPNPFRQIERYPIDRVKVEALKTSIKETSFWDNILVRKKNGKYQIAYGHHRLIAIREMGIEKIEAPVRDLDNAAMLRIMAEENIEWSTSPAVINETVLAVKTFLDAELAKYKMWEDACANKSIITNLVDNAKAFIKLRKQKSGQTTILKFLGSNWKQWMVQEALNTLRDKTIDKEAVESIPTLGQARTFKKAVKDYKIPRARQKAIAQRITKNSGEIEIIKTVQQGASKPEALKKDPACAKLERLVLDIDRQARTLRNKIMTIRREMGRLNVREVKGIKVLLAKSSLSLLFKEMKRLERKE